MTVQSSTMTLVAIRKYARSMMDQHGFEDVPFKWDNGTSRAGAVWYKRTTGEVTHLSLSRKLIPAFTDAQVTDTILHEIAHLIAGPRQGHNANWQAACIEVGARPVACYNPDEAFRSAAQTSTFAR